MRLYVDLDLRQLITSAGVKQPLSVLYLTRGDALDLEIQFVRGGVVQDPGAPAVFFCIKPLGEYDADPLVLDVAFTKTGSGTTALWTGQPNLNTEELDAELMVDDDETNDVAQLACSAEVGYTLAGRQTSTRTQRCIIENDLYRGAESPPASITTVAEGFTALTEGAQTGAITFAAALSGIPSNVQLTVEMPDGTGAVLFASHHSKATTGFSYVISADVPDTGYVLHWRASL